MIPKYKFEIGDFNKNNYCKCCGKQSFISHGFIYKNDRAYAIYYAGWGLNHTPSKVNIAISLGKWDDTSTSKDRICFSLNMFIKEELLEITFINPDQSLWSDTELLGPIIKRNQALKHPLKDEVLELLERITTEDNNIKDFINFIRL